MPAPPLRAALVAACLLLSACQSGSADVEAPSEAAADLEALEPTVQPAASRTRLASQADAPPVERQLIRTGAVRLRAADHGRAVAQTRALAEAVGGFVGDESSVRYADRVETTLTLRVPAPRFDTLLAAVSGLDGEVESRSVSVEDVTRQVADVEARLRTKRAAEARYLALLERAGTVDDVLAVQGRLEEVREDIESTEAQLRVLRDQVALSTLTVTLFEASAAGITAGPGFAARVGRAVGAGWDGLLEFTLALVAVWPAALIAAGLVWLWRRRRRRFARA